MNDSQTDGLESQPEQILVMNRLQLVLAQKRTVFGYMRIGVSLLALALAIFSALIATSSHYNVHRVGGYLVALVSANVVVMLIGFVLLGVGLYKLKVYDAMIDHLKTVHPDMAPYLD